MATMGIRELKDGLSQALRRVQEGDTVEVTDHGRPIARIVKAWPTPARQMMAEGRMAPPADEGDLLDLWPPPPLDAGERLGSEILNELRSAER